MGYVAGAESKQGALHGYVGGKPARREEPSNPQQRRQQPNLASPDPALANSAFTQSQFTTNLNQGPSAQEPTPDEVRRENLRRYNQSNGGGGACFTRPLANPGRSLTREPEPVVAQVAVKSEPSYVAYHLSDPGYAYKTFSGATGWFRVAQIVQPPNKVVKRVFVTAMTVAETADAEQPTAPPSFALRVVDTSNTPSKTLWADYDFSNTDDFRPITVDLATAQVVASDGPGLLEIQAQHSSGHPVLVSSVVAEIE